MSFWKRLLKPLLNEKGVAPWIIPAIYGADVGFNILSSLFGGQKRKKMDWNNWQRIQQEMASEDINRQFSPYRALASQMGRKEPQVGAQGLAKVSAEQRGTIADVYRNILRQRQTGELQEEAGQPAQPNIWSRLAGAGGAVAGGLSDWQERQEYIKEKARNEQLMERFMDLFRGQNQMGTMGINPSYNRWGFNVDYGQYPFFKR